MDSIVPALGSIFFLLYAVGGIALVVYLTLLFRRQVIAQERTAAAVERLANKHGEIDLSGIDGLG